MEPYYLIILDEDDNDNWVVINKKYDTEPTDNPVMYTRSTTIDPISGARNVKKVNVENGITGASGTGELVYISD